MKNILLFLLLCILLFTINNNLRENFSIKDLGKDLTNLNKKIKEIESSILKVFERSNFRILGFKNRELENVNDVENISKKLYYDVWNSKFINDKDTENKYKSKWKQYLYNKENLFKKLLYCNK